MIPLHERTPENWNVCIIRLNDYDPKLIDFNYCIKAFFMVADLRLVTPDTSTISDGEVAIFDMNGISYRHMTKVVFSTLKMFSKYTQEAHPICVRQTHIVNCSSMLGYLVNIAKPMIHADVLERIHFHFPKSDTLSKFIPTEMLPEEYSGNGGRMGDLKKYWIERLKEKR